MAGQGRPDDMIFVLGNPPVIDPPLGKAIEFDGATWERLHPNSKEERERGLPGESLGGFSACSTMPL